MIQHACGNSCRHDPVNHQRRREPERNNIGERVELAPKRTVVAAQARKASIQKIKNERAENEPDRCRENDQMPQDRRLKLCRRAPSRILSVAVNPQNRLPAVIRFGSR